MKSMIVLYRILSIIVNIAAVFLALSLLMSIPVLITSPLNLLSAFMLACIVLYAWYCNRFYRTVGLQQQDVKTSLRDLLRVNGIVTLIYSVFINAGMTMFIKKPDLLLEQLQKMGVTVQQSTMLVMLYVLLVFGVVLFVHVFLTFRLIRKYIAFFKA